MSENSRKRIPVNIISGPLGVGKTTMINHLLAQRPAEEKWAILVNEYGLVGIDGALMSQSPSFGKSSGVEIKEVAGGCICCSAGFMFGVSLVLLLQRHPDRLLIEPTGLAALSGILDTLDKEGIREAVDVRSIVCLIDPTRFDYENIRDEVKDQIEAADVLLSNRSDLASTGQLETFQSWAKSLFPPKRFIAQIEHGRIPLSTLDIVSERQEAVNRGGHTHGTDHQVENDAHNHDSGGHKSHGHDSHAHDSHGHDSHGHGSHGHDSHAHESHGRDSHGHDSHAHKSHAHESHGHSSHDHEHQHTSEKEATTGEAEEVVCNESNPIVQRSHRSSVASTIGWICWNELVFDAESVGLWLRDLSKLPGSRRTKAVVRTADGWWGFNMVDEIKEVLPTGYRRDSRVEVIIEGDQFPDTDAIEQKLRQCLVTTPSHGEKR